MSDKPTNPPAFPQLEVVADDRDGHGDFIDPFTVASGGMSLRDYIATAALNGMLAKDRDNPKLMAVLAYEYADAMLVAREVLA